MDLKSKIRNIKDFPKEGINFKDITTVLKDKEAFRYLINQMAEKLRDKEVDIIVGPEARGFLIGAPLAYELGAGFVPVRKPGKLPAETVSVEYELEYGTDKLEMHRDAIKPGQKVVVVDDLLATGGTVHSTVKLIEELGGEVVAISFFIELEFLNGRELLKDYEVNSIVKF
ncbi:adenine phosphoribosyltransferase [Caloranaerobacter azorensis]|uniref:Adenine phosphoribosyltransferase n=3 Tax=Caloranaerobacter azorensis TaxID=116090 RepID=A0A1M5TQ84_9FIRM|nr:adenine phosphoribosyltransferase [Caloranaerobacter azorensis]KGG81511.1 adenine phosphoribosyltransferase [Caloranaerobacter azorensis H53214]QIB26533.1 adenine phosphoribosyltransferase [Caloranaerobacter azorensis]SHH52985.1 adenine phosphoribosyltransferase [Caloranaerobacter azorensis DSM 13643]